MESKPILEIKNLTKIFRQDLFKPKQVVLDNVSMAFPEGSCTALMGHNGAGKTSLIRSIFGLLTPDSGTIEYRGKAIERVDKKKIGYMPETNKLPTNLTCEEILLHHLQVFQPVQFSRRDFKGIVEQQLKEVGLWEFKSRKVGKLSKGMGRRLSWAQATIHQPDLVILDEPSSGLDPAGYLLMDSLIKKLRDQKVSIVLCTHDLATVTDLCDHLHILRRGKLAYSSLDQQNTSLIDTRTEYIVGLSGISENEIRSMQQSLSLPEILSIDSKLHRVDVRLKNYASAQTWVQHLLGKGIVVVHLCRTHSWDAANIVKYFESRDTAL